MGIHQPIRKTVMPEIPDKLYFRIGDVARLCEVPAYVLRFWETEFPQLRPNKGGTGQRLYRKRDVEMALRIKSLLYDQGYTIPGARQVFKNEQKAREVGGVTQFPGTPDATPPAMAAAPAPAPSAEPAKSDDTGRNANIEARLLALRAEMAELLAMLGGTPAEPPKPAGAPKPKALRPQLVVDRQPTFAKPEAVRDRRQADLFPFE
jgi:DNA-binding transcriptional MerR regulator